MAGEAVKVTTKYLEKLELEVARSAVSQDAEAVHDLRVAVRRTVQALRVFEDQLPRGAGKQLRKRISKIRDRAAAVRDRDVTEGLLEKHTLPANDPACAYLRGERAMAAKALRKAMKKLVKKKTVQDWMSVLGGK